MVSGTSLVYVRSLRHYTVAVADAPNSGKPPGSRPYAYGLTRQLVGHMSPAPPATASQLRKTNGPLRSDTIADLMDQFAQFRAVVSGWMCKPFGRDLSTWSSFRVRFSRRRVYSGR